MKHLVFKRPFRWQETAKYLGLCTKVLETTKTNRKKSVLYNESRSLSPFSC